MSKKNDICRLTRIVATVGPACDSPQMIEILIKSGVDVFRLNFSHGSHESHGKTYNLIRQTSEKLGAWTSVLQDISGPKLRIGSFKDGSVDLKPGSNFRLEKDLESGDGNSVGFSDEGWFASVDSGQRIILGDGQIVLRLIRKDTSGMDCEVVSGG